MAVPKNKKPRVEEPTTNQHIDEMDVAGLADLVTKKKKKKKSKAPKPEDDDKEKDPSPSSDPKE